MKKWYEVNALVAEKKASVNILGYIGGEVSSLLFSSDLDYLESQGITQLDIYINSLGGSMWDGNHIFNRIKMFKGKVNGYNIGVAASMASLILMACDQRYMAGNAQLMIHNPTISVYDVQAEEMDGIKNMALTMKDTAAQVYADVTGMAKDKVLEMMAATTWMSAEQALEMKFINGIMDLDVVFPTEDQDFDVALYNYANVPQIVASAYSKRDHNTMNDPTKKPEGEGKAPQVDNAVEVNALRKELDDMKKKAAHDRAELLVDNAIQQKKITPAMREKYVTLADADYESVKGILDEMKPAVEISATLKTGDGASNGGSERDKWTYDDWAEKDSKGLIAMKANDPKRFEALQQAKIAEVRSSGKISLS